MESNQKQTGAAWREAAGSCGLNLGERQVDAAYVNGVALFAFESNFSNSSTPFFSCVVTGHMSCGASTLDEAKAKGVVMAMEMGAAGADRRMSRAQFETLVATPERLYQADDTSHEPFHAVPAH